MDPELSEEEVCADACKLVASAVAVGDSATGEQAEAEHGGGADGVVDEEEEGVKARTGNEEEALFVAEGRGTQLDRGGWTDVDDCLSSLGSGSR